MNKLFCIGMSLAMFMSTTAFSVSANEEVSNGSIQIVPEFKQIQEGNILVVKATVTNADEANKVVYTLTQKNDTGEVVSAKKMSVDLQANDSSVFKSTFAVENIGANDTFILTAQNESGTVVAETQEMYSPIEMSVFANSDTTLEISVDEELDSVWDMLQSDPDMSIQPMAATSLKSRNTLQYSSTANSGYSEGLLQTGATYFESAVTNYGNSTESATFYVASYLTTGELYQLDTVDTGNISAGSTTVLTSEDLTITTSIYNSLDYIRTYTWTPSMTPCCDATRYTKNSHYDNFTLGSSITTKGDNYLLLNRGQTVRGSLSSSSDVDAVAYNSRANGTVTISKLTTPGGSFKIDVYDNSGRLVSSNPSSFSAQSGQIYYLRIYGTTSGNYAFRVN